MVTKIQLRRGNAAEWTLSNPILADGEQGLEKDTNKIKIGNGVNRWVNLPYYSPTGDIDLTEFATSEQGMLAEALDIQVQTLDTQVQTLDTQVTNLVLQPGLDAITAEALHRSPNSVVSMFIYDTSKDSDGGAWTEKCHDTSWYNEPICGKWLGVHPSEISARALTGATTADYFKRTTDGKFYKLNETSGVTEVFRGNKRDFPKLAGIIAEGSNVTSNITIYDLTEPDLPMWMRFEKVAGAFVFMEGAWPIIDVKASNGVLAFIDSADVQVDQLAIANFPFDSMRQYVHNAGILESNVGISSRNSPTVGFVSWFGQYDIAKATKIPFPLGTGYNQLRQYGLEMRALKSSPTNQKGLTEVTIAVLGSTNKFFFDGGKSIRVFGDVELKKGVFLSDDKFIATSNNTSFYTLDGLRTGTMVTVTNTAAPGFGVGGNTAGVISRGGSHVSKFAGSTVQHITRNQTNSASLVSTISSAFNTGYQSGDTRRVLLSDTDPGVITNGAQLVINGDFSSSTDWILDGTWIISDGSLVGVNSTNMVRQNNVTTPGKGYRVSFEYNSTSSNQIRICNTSGIALAYLSVPSGTSGTVTSYFVATGTTLIIEADLAPYTGTIDNISVQEVIADRSYKAQYISVAGSLIKTQVATAAQLVAYSGFSETNYIQEPYSSDLDFGTGEWSMGAWIKLPTNITQTVTGDLIGSLPTAAAWINDVNGTTVATDVADGVLFTAGSSGAWLIKTLPVTPTSLSVKVTCEFSVSNNTELDFYISGMRRKSGSSGSVGNTILMSYYTTRSHYVVSTIIDFVDLSPKEFGFVTSAFSSTYTIHSLKIENIKTNTILSRSCTSGPKLELSTTVLGSLVATVNDGVTTRVAASAITPDVWLKTDTCYTTDGTLSLRVNGSQVAATYGNPLLSLNSRYNLLSYTENFTDPEVWGGWQGTGQAGTDILDFINGPDVYQYITAPAATNYLVEFDYSIASGPDASFYASFQGSTKATINATSTVQRYSAIHTTSVTNGYFIFERLSTGSAFRVSRISIVPAGVLFPYQRVGASTDFDNKAPLTIGNSYNLSEPFPGSIALLKFSATVPTTEQSTWMYEQEKQMFREGAQCCLPDSNSIVDIAYDETTDKWVTASTTNVSEWRGLVRTNVTTGSYSKLTAGSGLTMYGRTTTSPGVDITIPSYSFREELVKRAESAARLNAQLASFDYVGGFTATTVIGDTAVTSISGLDYPSTINLIGCKVSGVGIPADTVIQSISNTAVYFNKPVTTSGTSVQISFIDFPLPIGYEAKNVSVAGVLKREGATKDFIRLFDGFKETIRFGIAPGYTTWVQIQGVKI